MVVLLIYFVGKPLFEIKQLLIEFKKILFQLLIFLGSAIEFPTLSHHRWNPLERNPSKSRSCPDFCSGAARRTASASPGRSGCASASGSRSRRPRVRVRSGRGLGCRGFQSRPKENRKNSYWTLFFLVSCSL